MKRLAIIISILSITFASFAGGGDNSSKRSHKGKNYKPWEHKREGNVNSTDREVEKGPKGKNAKPWDDKERGDSFSKSKERVTGPKYKNAKRW